MKWLISARNGTMRKNVSDALLMIYISDRVTTLKELPKIVYKIYIFHRTLNGIVSKRKLVI